MLPKEANATAKWIYKNSINNPFSWITELIRLTNIAFGVNSNAIPIFLLDNVHALAKINTDKMSMIQNKNHTVLSILMNDWNTLKFDNETMAIYLLSLNVYFTDDYLPGTNICVNELQDDALAFPYGESFVIPSFFWLNISTKNPSRWKRILSIIKNMVPGLEFDNLYLSYKILTKVAYNTDKIGEILENMIVSSLMVKYILALKKYKLKIEDIEFTDIYHLEKENSLAYNFLSEISVNIKNGISYPQEEDEEKSILISNTKMIYHNKKIHNAHHDIILTAKPMNLAIQCKNSMYKPNEKTIDLQLNIFSKKRKEREEEEEEEQLLY